MLQAASSVQSVPSCLIYLSFIADQIPWEVPSNSCTMKYQEILVVKVCKWEEEALTSLDMQIISAS
jgi:hypothetical protein